jgi:cytochrome P450
MGCFLKTLRMNGPTPIIIPRIAAEDTTLSGTFIPKGTFVNVAIQCIQHSEMYWKDPETFDPDRFSEDGEKNISTQGMTFLPFGGGPRTCLGQNMSYNEQRVMMSMLCKYLF